MARFEGETDPTRREMVAELIALRCMPDRKDPVERVYPARHQDAQLAQCFARYVEAIVQELLTETASFSGYLDFEVDRQLVH